MMAKQGSGPEPDAAWGGQHGSPSDVAAETKPPPAAKPAGRPDAVKLPATARFTAAGEGPSTLRDRVVAVSEIAEPLLQIDKSKGERAYIRRMPNNGPLFITRDTADTLYFVIGHPMAGQERYRWEPQGDDIFVGYLIET
jgi:hypothetical protein